MKRAEQTYKNTDKVLLILDLDETLIHATKEELSRKADFMLSRYHVYKRPYLASFIKEVSEDFLLAIWSSASDDYVEAMVQKIIPKNIRLEFIWGSSRCVYKRNISMDEYRIVYDDGSNPYYYAKPLKKVKRQGYNIQKWTHF